MAPQEEVTMTTLSTDPTLHMTRMSQAHLLVVVQVVVVVLVVAGGQVMVPLLHQEQLQAVMSMNMTRGEVMMAIAPVLRVMATQGTLLLVAVVVGLVAMLAEVVAAVTAPLVPRDLEGVDMVPHKHLQEVAMAMGDLPQGDQENWIMLLEVPLPPLTPTPMDPVGELGPDLPHMAPQDQRGSCQTLTMADRLQLVKQLTMTLL